MFLRYVCLMLALAGFAFSQMKMSVEQLSGFIKSSVQNRLDDKKIAEYVHRVQLTNRLEASRVEDLRILGAGPKTVLALRELIETSRKLPEPPPPPPPKSVAATTKTPPPPDFDKILQQITDQARNYSANLPNYICAQVTRRFVDPTGSENWKSADTIQEQLTYFEQKEAYKVVMVNGKAAPETLTHDKLGGATSSGEFGSILNGIFAPETRAEFSWDHLGKWHGRIMYVLGFDVPASRSSYTIYHHGTQRKITAGMRGLIYADRDTGMVMRIKTECTEIPADYPIQKVELELNYDFIKIADNEFVLPLHSELRSKEGSYLAKNETDFRLYRKYGTSSDIKFEEFAADTPKQPEKK
jgi:hypothetical protein